jgi:hypothetical protein
MKGIIAAAWVFIALCGCAGPESLQLEAVNHCQEVGITESDPQFYTCARSYALQHREDVLNENYRIQADTQFHDRSLRRKGSQ